MQFKKSQHEMIEKIIELSDDIVFCKKEVIPNGRREVYKFLNSPNKQLIFEKRGNHRYWYLEDI